MKKLFSAVALAAFSLAAGTVVVFCALEKTTMVGGQAMFRARTSLTTR